MATLRNKRKLAAVTREIQEENPRNGQSRNTSVPRINEEYITQVSEEIEGRITKKLSKEFNRIESRISDALFKLDEFLSNQQIQTHSKTVPGTFRSTNVENQGTNEDDSQSDPHPEAGIFHGHTTQNLGPKDCRDMVTGATREILQCRDMVTGVTGKICHCRDMLTGIQGEIHYRPDMVRGASEEMRNGLDMVTAVQEDIPYCSSGISSGKQKTARSTNQPQIRSENTLATIEADQILLALQQLPTNSNSSKVNNNSNRISKLPKSLKTTMPTFDGKSEKFELFEDLFQTSLKIHNQLTEEDKINYFHSLMRGDALQTFKNISSPNRENLTEILTVFRRKYVEPQSMVTAKHKFQRLVFNPANQKLIDFLDELQKLARDAFGVAAQDIIEQFIYAKMPPHLKKSINQTQLENGTYKQIVSRLKRELELIGLEAPDEQQINTVTQQVTQQNSENAKPICHHCKKPGHYRNQCRQLKREKDRARNNTNSAGNNNNNNGSAQTNPNSNKKVSNNTNAGTTNSQKDRRLRPFCPPCETCVKNNHTTEKCYFRANAANRLPPQNRRPEGKNQIQQRNAQSNSHGNVYAAALKLETPRPHSGPVCDRPETNEIPRLPPIAEVVFQQPTEIITNQVNLK